MISVLCTMAGSNYEKIPGLDLWNADRDAYRFTGSNPVITHAPCQQWSKMKGFAYKNPDEKELAFQCLKYVLRNGGIFEHPKGSSFFKEAGITKNLYSVDQSWWGFKGKKTTILLFHGFKPLAFPISFTAKALQRVDYMSSPNRSRMTLEFCQWLVDNLKQ